MEICLHANSDDFIEFFIENESNELTVYYNEEDVFPPRIQFNMLLGEIRKLDYEFKDGKIKLKNPMKENDVFE